MRVRTLVGLAFVLQACASRVAGSEVDARAADGALLDAPARDVVAVDAVPRDTASLDARDFADAPEAVDAPVRDAPAGDDAPLDAPVPDDAGAAPDCFAQAVPLWTMPAREPRIASNARGAWVSWTDDVPGGARHALFLPASGAAPGPPRTLCSSGETGDVLQTWAEGEDLWMLLATAGPSAALTFCSTASFTRVDIWGRPGSELRFLSARPVAEGDRFIRVLTFDRGMLGMLDVQRTGDAIGMAIMTPMAEEPLDAAWQDADTVVLSHRAQTRDEGTEEIRLLRVDYSPRGVSTFTPLPSLPIRRAAPGEPVLSSGWSDNSTIAALRDGTVAVNHAVPTPASRETTQELARVVPGASAAPSYEPLGSTRAWLAPLTATLALTDPSDAVLAAWSSHGGGGFNTVLHAAYLNTTDRTLPPPRRLESGLPGDSQVTGVALGIDAPRSRALIAFTSRARDGAGSTARGVLALACMPLP